MKVILLGTGGPIVDVDRKGPATIIDINGTLLLFDAGRGVTIQLVKAKVDLKSIGLIFITHHHMDHISDLGDLILSIWKAGRTNKLQILGPDGTSEIVSALLNQVFIQDIEYTLALEKSLKFDMVDIRTLIEVTNVQPGIIYENNDFIIKTEYVEHGHKLLGFSQETWPSLGYRVETNETIIALSGDAIICDGLMKLTQNTDILIQCCYLAKAEINNSEYELISNSVIASSEPIGKFATQAKVNMLILTHFRKKYKKMMDLIELDIRKYFSGKLYLGYDLQIFNVN